eukprot:TRINITY_DN526_c0_g1_i1.p1 TRINITY_DN526_c0_g1~~TRINITY_DN526_c0_g1_i1.p1  ORF type:complete len:430 (+),score=142.09 TRINITY_DN526_c0_g1_i1:88-1377(+)
MCIRDRWYQRRVRGFISTAMASKGTEMLSVEMESLDGGCCGGQSWKKAEMMVNPDGSLTVKEDEEKGNQTKYASDVKYEKGRLLITMDGQTREVKALHESAKAKHKLEKFQREFAAATKFPEKGSTPAKRQKPGKGYGTVEHNTTSEEGADAEEPEEDTGVMWCGTCFTYDQDGDGSIDLKAENEYKLESQVIADSPFQFSGTAKVAKQILEKHVLGTKMWEKILKSNSIHFKLKAGGADLQVYVGFKREWSTLVFVLAADNTEVAACANLATDAPGGVLHHEQGLIRQHFGDKLKKAGGKMIERSLFQGMNAAKKKKFDDDVQKKIKEVNDQNLKNLLLEQEGDTKLKELKEKLFRNMQTIEDRTIAISRNKKAAEQIQRNLNALKTGTKKVKEVACWKRCRRIICCTTLVTLLLTGVFLFLYFYLKK